jgi:hypothetical protein
MPDASNFKINLTNLDKVKKDLNDFEYLHAHLSAGSGRSVILHSSLTFLEFGEVAAERI